MVVPCANQPLQSSDNITQRGATIQTTDPRNVEEEGGYYNNNRECIISPLFVSHSVFRCYSAGPHFRNSCPNESPARSCVPPFRIDACAADALWMLLEIMKLFFPAVCFPFHYQAPKALAPLERSLFGLFFLIRRSFTIFSTLR